MEVFRGLADFRPLMRPTAVAVGNFDGVHLGHRKILSRLCKVSQSGSLRSLVLTFCPHPERVLGKKLVRMIDTFGQKLEKLEEAGIEAVLVTKFDRTFAGLGQTAFLENILKGHLHARDIVIGRDFRFGRNRSGNAAALRRIGRRLGLGVHVVPPAILDGTVISSSAIRRLLARGHVEGVARMLGRPYEITGRVVKGRARGRRLGFPTANIKPENEILPNGVYITEMIVRGQPLPSVTSIGTNPTFGRNPVSVESYVLGCAADFYGAVVALRFHLRIRATRTFADAGGLAAGIARDVEAAQTYFSRRTG